MPIADDHANDHAYLAGKAILIPAFALPCLILPFEFLSVLDGLRQYRSLPELLNMFAYSWLIYAGIGLLTSLPLLIIWFYGKLSARPFVQHGSTAVGIYGLVVWTAYTFVSSAIAWLQEIHAVEIPLDLRSRVVMLVVLGMLSSPILFRRDTLTYWLNKLDFVPTLFLILLMLFGVYVVSDRTVYPSKVAAASSAFGGPPSKGPPIILISIDSLTARHMSIYGYSLKTTPHLAKLAEQSTVFDRFYANSNFTTPTVNSLINGVRPWTHRVMHVGGNGALDQKIASTGMAAELKKGGYETYAVATNIWAAPNQNGNDVWFDKVAYGRANLARIRASVLLARLPLLTPILGFNTINSLSSVVNRVMQALGYWSGNQHFDPSVAIDIAKNFLEQSGTNRSVFLWVHLLPPHDPYAAPIPFLGQFDKRPAHDLQRNSSPPYGFAAGNDPHFPQDYVGRYDESILYVDHHVGEFMDWLKDKGWFENSIVIITADHGESFNHGYGGHTGVALYEDLIHIPLIVKLPGQRQPHRVPTVCKQVYVEPTILDAVGIAPPAMLEGRSRLKEIRGEKGTPNPVITMNFERASRFDQLTTGTVAMIDGRWKYIRYMGYRPSDTPGLSDSLFDIEQDPDEQHDLSQAEPHQASRMKASIDAQLAQRGGPIH